ncbi:hypothetical protein ACHAQJ_006348 [Trichoderma viride]
MERSSHPSFFSLNAKAAAADYSSSESESDDPTVPGLNADDNDFGDFNPRKKRRVGGNSKEKAALGIFGSDSEDDNPSSRWKRKTLRSKGVNFVSTANEGAGQQDVGSESENEQRFLGSGLGSHGRDSEEDEDEDEDEDDRPAGLGLGSAAMKLRFTASEKSRQDDAQKESSMRPSFQTNFSSGGILGGGFVPSSARDPVLRETKNGNDTPRNKPQLSAFTTKGKINPKSFGARMMAKMGYVEGKGLGKEGEGRNIIIEANLRPQGIGLGAVKEKTAQERQEEKRQAKLRGEEVVDSEEEEKKRRKARKKARGTAAYSSGGSTPMRQKTKYLTAEELRKTAPGLNIPEAFAPILDMTGPGGKLLTSTSGIMTPSSSGVPESSEVIEARKLAKRAQADLLAFSEEWRNLEGRKTWVNLELKQREQETEDLRSDFERLQMFANMVTERLVDATEWEQVISALQTAVDLGSANDAIADIAVAAIHPFLRSSDWDPMTEPTRFASDLQKLSGLLMTSANTNKSMHKWNSSAGQDDDGVYRTHHKATTPYETMMYKNWLPRILTALRSWDPFNPTPMLNIMENWKELLPPFVRAQLVDNVARKLETAVSDWNPRKKRQSHHLPHTWLFPWLQYLPPYHLDPRGTGLVADVRRKFRHLIDAWEFERGVVPGLTQWKDVLGDQWRPLIMSHVLPSMGKYLRTNFRVDPAEQEPYLPILVGIMKWNQILGDAVLAEVLVQDMFPMWSSRLQEWLALDEADLGEVADWYSWWRGVLLKDMAEIKAVRVELDRGLQLVNMI